MADKTVLITGASSGIGKVAARDLSQAGFNVYAVARRTEPMQELCKHGVTTIKMDVTCDKDIDSVLGQISDKTGGVDILVNNAGFSIQGPFEEMPLEDARAIFDVNLFGLGRLTQGVVPYMREKRQGRIINVGSAAGRVYLPLNAWYVASKHALEGFNDCLRSELSQFGIKVVLIEPGAIDTEFNEVATSKPERRSTEGPYARLVNAFANMDLEGSLPEVISDVILKAATVPRPKTRYVAGNMARETIMLRKWLGDGFYDKLLWSIIKV